MPLEPKYFSTCIPHPEDGSGDCPVVDRKGILCVPGL